MTKRLASVDLELYGVQHTFEFDSPVRVESDDEVEVGVAVLRDVTSLEVNLVQAAPAGATVTVGYRLIIEGETDVDLEGLDGYSIEDEDDIRDLVEQGEFYAVSDAIENSIERYLDASDASIEHVSVDSVYDEEGEPFEWE